MKRKAEAEEDGNGPTTTTAKKTTMQSSSLVSDDPAEETPWYIEENLEMSRLILNVDWKATSLGPLDDWPMCLKTSLSICLGSRFPMVLWFGKEFTMLYNDAYKPLLGSKHPKALGVPGRVCWAEIWNIIGPMLEEVVNTGKASWTEDLPLMVERSGYVEETYWTFSYSPIRSSKRVTAGVFTAVEESSSRYIQERRLRTLRDLSAKTTPTGGNLVDFVTSASRDAVNTLTSNRHDVPYAALYRMDSEHQQLVFEASAAVRAGIPGLTPEVIQLDAMHEQHDIINTILQVLKQGIPKECPLSPELVSVLGKLPPWDDLPRSVVILPLSSKAQFSNMSAGSPTPGSASVVADSPSKSSEADLGVLLLGVNTHQVLCDNYFTFLNLVSSQVSSALVAARAYQQERKRAEMLAELDRAKTTFFSNISHEFRTPLTLMIGPLEGVLNSSCLNPADQEQLQLVYRNSLRLLKLVNVLLDFSRIEAGRMQAVFRPVDLSALTAELASVFRSASEKAGLQLIVDTQPLSERVYVDADMWEKIVLNLLSNAYKYTLKGKIEVQMKEVNEGTAAELRIRDTGCGIPQSEMPRLFERFHRISTSKGRTHEGTGIGLALVFELVRLHGGQIRAESKEDEGTVFYVTLPFGQNSLLTGTLVRFFTLGSHLPADHIVAPAEDARNELEQNRRVSHMRNLEWWVQTPSAMDSSHELLPSSSSGPLIHRSDSDSLEGEHHKIAHVLVVDDNADMQGYVSRILAEHYQVSKANNGLAALDLLQRTPLLPDLILSDIMMPHLDGFGLLKAIRSDDKLRDIPVIFLSAQAGEEARSIGIAAGADDYLVKPFSAKELLTRVSARLELARVRAAASKKEQMLREEAERANRSKDHFLAVLSHELRNPLVPVLLVAEALGTDSSIPQRIRDDLTLISRNVQLEVQLINDLLDVTKISQHKLTFQLLRVDAHEIMQYAVRMFAQAFQEKKLRVLLDLTAIDHFVMADSARLQQIYWNLLGNAIKFTPEEGSITIRSRNEWANSQRILQIDVIDTGVGIEPAVLPKLFNAFEQGGDAVNRKFGETGQSEKDFLTTSKGLGLGLSIAKALATMHGGELRAYSDGRNKGARFSLTLPSEVVSASVAAAQRRHSATTAENELLAQEKKRSLYILLIEDNITNLKVMERMLASRLGHRVVTANSFESAVQALKDHQREPFDRILCDLGLPDGNGLDLMPHITATHPHARAIALTGYGTDSDLVRSKNAGFSLHLTKPVTLAQLERALSGPIG